MPEETKIVYYIDNQQSPYVSYINTSSDIIKLKDFKAAINKVHYKFFFHSEDKEFGNVKEEIVNDDCLLPQYEGRIVAWLVSLEHEAVEPTSSFLPKPVVEDKFVVPSNGDRGTSVQDSPPIISNPNIGRLPTNQQLFNYYGSQSTLSSTDNDTYYSREDQSEYSSFSGSTASNRKRNRDRRRKYRKTRPKRSFETSSVYSSSITDSSLSLNIIKVTLNMEKYNFLGISLIGQSNENGDGSTYIGSIMKGGAVAADGRIQPGDMLLQVNDVNFENMSNEEAVNELRAIVGQPGAITLTIAKCWDVDFGSDSFTIPKNEPVRPIDPQAWAHNIATVQNYFQANNLPTSTTNGTGSDPANSLPESERYDRLPLSARTGYDEVVRCMRMTGSGLEVKTRTWLKITIHNAFIGSDLVTWLQQKVEGLEERRTARKYASDLLKRGYIRHTVNKNTFSEQCYYVFGDFADIRHLPQDIHHLSLGDSNSDSRDSDPLHPPGAAYLPGDNLVSRPASSLPHSRLIVTGAAGGPRPLHRIGNDTYNETATISMMSSASHDITPHHQGHRSSCGGSDASGSDRNSESRLNVRSIRPGTRSSGDQLSPDNGRAAHSKQLPSVHTAAPPKNSLPLAGRGPTGSLTFRPVHEPSRRVGVNRQSFQTAIGVPKCHVIDPP